MHLAPFTNTDDELAASSDEWGNVRIFDYRTMKEVLQLKLNGLDVRHSAEASRVHKLIVYVEQRALRVEHVLEVDGAVLHLSAVCHGSTPDRHYSGRRTGSRHYR